MAEIAEGGGGGHGKGGKKRAKKQSTRVDMTPMVDLAFLLLTFFVLTATFSKNKAMDITFPAPPEGPPPPPTKNAVTFMLTKEDRVFYYVDEFFGPDSKENPPTALTEINYAPDGQKGIRDLLKEKNKKADILLAELEEERQRTKMADTTFRKRVNSINNKSDAVTVIIKADGEAKYRNVVQLIDELKLLKISKFVNVDMTPAEADLLKAATGGSAVPAPAEVK
jgi:biopolymer transport protein ExbD